MANCSKDAILNEVEVTVSLRDELFKAKGVKVVEANFLEIYGKFMKIDEKSIPHLVEGEIITPS